MNKSIEYNISGSFVTINDLLPNNKPFFRKFFTESVEKKITKIIKLYPHPNIVTIYNITNKYVDMELLTPINNNLSLNTIEKNKIIKLMENVKNHLQSYGIIYLDWKFDNIGIDTDGNYKLFDFDVSGIINLKTKLWIIRPFPAYAYNKSIEFGINNPIKMDNFCFSNFNLSM